MHEILRVRKSFYIYGHSGGKDEGCARFMRSSRFRGGGAVSGCRVHLRAREHSELSLVVREITLKGGEEEEEDNNEAEQQT